MSKVYTIKGQTVTDTGKFLNFHIRNPIYFASDLYRWKKDKYGRVGIGVSENILRKAEKLGRKLRITYHNKSERYTITPSLFRKYAFGKYTARGSVKILVAPASKFTHLKKKEQRILEINPEEYKKNMKRLASIGRKALNLV